MKLLTVIKNGKFTGVQYEQDSDAIRAHHASQGEMLVFLDYRLTANEDGDYGVPSVGEIKEGNKLKAKIEQNARLQELIKNDKRKEIGLPPVMTNADEETIKDYVKALQADVESPSEDEAYNPPLPPSVTPPAIKSLVVLVAREEGWQGNLGFRIVLKAADESYTPTNLALSVYLQPECNDYLYTTGAFQYDAENDEYYAVCPPGQEPGDSIVYMGLLYGSAPLACWTLKTGEMQKKIYAYEEA
jgi:hypothetical protein